MKPPPFALGTDITQLTRWDLKSNPYNIVRLANRMLHNTELAVIRRYRPEMYKIIQPGPTLSSAESSRTPVLPELRRVIESREYQELLTPVNCTGIRNYLGGRWAAKEAARKAWGPTLLSHKDVRIFRNDEMLYSAQDREVSDGLPRIFCQPLGLYESSVDGSATTIKGVGFCLEGRLSISHDGDYAVATVIAEPLSSSAKRILMALRGNTRASQQDSEEQSQEKAKSLRIIRTPSA